jgi:iron-sulfur cluster assembly protein
MKEFSLTERAEQQVNTLCKDKSIFAVCLSVKGGGCAGFEYEWKSVDQPGEVVVGSYILDTGEGHFVVDADSTSFFEGTQVDYTVSITGSKFEINNPNARAACGCGVSVNFDMDQLDQSGTDNTESLGIPVK